LTALRAGGQRSARFDAAVADAVRELDRMRATARQARGAERAALLERLNELDAALLRTALDEVDAASADALRAEAEAEIAPFAARMTAEARQSATSVAFERLVRAAFGMPVLAFL
jgi:hypothetical protein